MGFEQKPRNPVGRPAKTGNYVERFVEKAEKEADHNKVIGNYTKIGFEVVETKRDGFVLRAPVEAFDAHVKRSQQAAIDSERRVSPIDVGQYAGIAKVNENTYTQATTEDLANSLIDQED